MHVYSGHLVFLAAPAWGHLRPLTHLATKVVQVQAEDPMEQRAVITLFTAGDFTQRVKDEVALIFDQAVPEIRNGLQERIRIISIGGKGSDPMVLIPFLFGHFSQYYELLLAEEKVMCALTGYVYEPVAKPTAAVIDFLAHPVLEVIVSKQTPIPVLAWMPTTAAALLYMFGPEELGGMGDVQSRIVEVIGRGTKTDAEVKQIKEQAWRPSKGNIFRIPGLKGMEPFYDYEGTPQEPSPFYPHAEIVSRAFELISLSAGILLVTSPSYEPIAVSAVHSWFVNSGKVFYPIGPLVPPGYGAKAAEEHAGLMTSDLDEGTGANRGSEVTRFLDVAVEKYGHKSVLYIAFGTVFWPTKQEYLWAWTELLLELGVPFILSTASLVCDTPESLVARSATSGTGLLTAWAPQESILTHSAIGWFMSHCGQNSVTEAMTAGVPIIAWPIEGDQPLAAAYLALTLDVAFELIQVRTGSWGLRPLYRGVNPDIKSPFVQPQGTLKAVREEAQDIMSRAKGEEGQRKRRKAEELRDKLKDAWEVGGDARKNLESFLGRFASRE